MYKEMLKYWWDDGKLNEMFEGMRELVINGCVIGLLFRGYKELNENSFLILGIILSCLLIGSMFTKGKEK